MSSACRRLRSIRNLVLGLSALYFPSAGFADEGMWLLNKIPTEYIKAKYGIDVTPEVARHMMLSTIRMDNGGSASFVSPNGLLLTNHHVGASVLHDLATEHYDHFVKGYLATSPDKELRAPNLEVSQLVNIIDVTERVKAVVLTGMSAEDANAARKAEIATIEKEYADKSKLHGDVVTLYQGGQYHLYQYKKYTDVRLVFAPEYAAAAFGGDEENFEYPRYDLDMCLFRVYDDTGTPLKTDSFLKWSTAPVKEGDFVYVVGNPGGTGRLLTVAQVEFHRDVGNAQALANLKHNEQILLNFSAQSEEHARMAKGELLSAQNGRKARSGWETKLADPAFVERKRAEENRLRDAVAKEPRLNAAAGAWDEIVRALDYSRANHLRRTLLSLGTAFNTTLFGYARMLVRIVDEDLKPNSQRLPAYRETNRSSMLQHLFSEAPVYAQLEEYTLADSLASLAVALAGDPLLDVILAGKSPADRARELISGTRLFDPAVRKHIHDGKREAVVASLDPMILLVRKIDEESRRLQKGFEENVEEPLKQAHTRLEDLRFKLDGDTRYPDATFTPRLAFGTVKGYEQDGQTYSYQTTMGGARQYEAKMGGKKDYVFPDVWHNASLEPAVQFNFVSDVDIIGGNSGSPVISSCGKLLVGLIFDGNRSSNGGFFEYRDNPDRAVSVSAEGMLHVLERVYRADALVREIKGL